MSALPGQDTALSSLPAQQSYLPGQQPLYQQVSATSPGVRTQQLMKPHTNEAVSSAPGGPSCRAPPAAAPTSACPWAAAPRQRRGPAHLV